MAQSGIAQAKVIINGEDVDNEAVAFVMVEMDLDQADLCTATIKNTNDKKYTVDLKLGDTVEVKLAETSDGQQKSIFKGEVMGLEPCYESGGETHVLLRAVNKLHRLSRGKKSKTFEQKTDAQIAQAICSDYSLTCNVQGDVNITYDHVYQHHQTDLEFLLTRARRINYEVSVDDTTLTFKKRDIAAATSMNLKMGAQGDTSGRPLNKLQLRLSSANQVTAVKVRAWDPKTNKEIVGKADSLDKTLGATTGGSAAKTGFPTGTHKATYDVPVSTQEEADAIAKSMLEDHALNYITGEAYCKGNPDLKAGMVVNVAGTDTRFDGPYYVQGAIHKYTHKSGGSGGYTTLLKVRRNAEGQAS
jgi:phage protein D